jgi:(p)ppGpp synthase/HD superfamily hydrolase
MNHINEAILFATKKHDGQFRKGTNIPYITHPLKVMKILTDNQCSENVIIAGILHDTLEDTSATSDEIRTLFGDNVLAIVSSETEDKSKSWKERKANTISHLKTASLEIKLVCCADKLANLRDMVDDYANIGEILWQRFNAPKTDIAWYYNSIKNELSCLSEYKMFQDFEILCNTFFK